MDARVEVVAVAVAGRVLVTVAVEALVHAAVAVVVLLVADFGGSRVGARFEVVAVGHWSAQVEPVAVGVRFGRRDGAVAVGVEPVADLVRVEMHGGVRVVAVAFALAVAVLIHVEAVVHDPVAVLVFAVAALAGAGMNERVVVVAVHGEVEAVAVHVRVVRGRVVVARGHRVVVRDRGGRVVVIGQHRGAVVIVGLDRLIAAEVEVGKTDGQDGQEQEAGRVHRWNLSKMSTRPGTEARGDC